MLKTDYKKRLALLKSGKIRLVVRRSNNNFIVQFAKYDESGDFIICSVISKMLKNFGWNYSVNNTPGAYLTGLLAGVTALKKGVKEVILDIGLHVSTPQNRLYAVAKGIKDSGIAINIGDVVVPDENRLSGKHIADYAVYLKKENKELYDKIFSGYKKNNVEPENIVDDFEKTKVKIMGSKQR